MSEYLRSWYLCARSWPGLNSMWWQYPYWRHQSNRLFKALQEDTDE